MLQLYFRFNTAPVDVPEPKEDETPKLTGIAPYFIANV